VKGAVPGHADGVLVVKPSIKKALRDEHAAAKK
jgi:large subunit ribosomal protein L3